VRNLAIGIIAAAGLLSALLTVLNARWEELSVKLRVGKGMLIVAFLTIGIAATIVSMPRPEMRDNGAEEETTRALPAATALSTSRWVPTPSSSTNSDREADPRIAKTRPTQPRLHITDAAGASVYQLEAAARDLRATYSLHGVLQDRSEQSPELQNLYTVHLTLSATVTQGSSVVDAFTVRSRGGGFQIEAARAQALDRLAMALQKRLAEVR
jgi:hypothetical protein